MWQISIKKRGIGFCRNVKKELDRQAQAFDRMGIACRLDCGIIERMKISVAERHGALYNDSQNLIATKRVMIGMKRRSQHRSGTAAHVFAFPYGSL